METAQPNPTWDAEAHSEVVDVLEASVGEVSYEIWGADWCKDCRSALPDFFAALEAAGVPDGDVGIHEVDRDKDGEGVEEYDVSLIPTIVVEQDGEEVARFEESEDRPAAQYLADQLERDDDVMV